MKKIDLEERVRVAWFRATGQDDGWEVWLRMEAEDVPLMERAYKFGVALKTIYRWRSEQMQGTR